MTQNQRQGRQGRHRKRKRKRKSTKLSDHFSKKDFTCPCGECNNKLRLSLGLIGALELLRKKADNRIQILKGYQCPESYEKLKKFKKNYHTMGLAVDIQIENIDAKDAFLLAESIPEIKGLGLNITENFLHIDTRKEDEKLLWVMGEDDEQTPITDDNRSKFLDAALPPHVDEPAS